jgi:hypothetical protein
MNIVIGCPFSDRGWILDRWLDHIYAAFSEANIEPSFIFVTGSGNEEDIDLLSSIPNATTRVVSEDSRNDIRRWNHSRYEHMVYLRNVLLNCVRERNPDLFLSLDSDILLAPNSIVSALDALDNHPSAWAVGLKCFMSPTSLVHPSMGIWRDLSFTRFSRTNTDDIATVDIVMAAKLMKPEAYNIDYSFHRNGEDLGWSLNVKNAGGKFIWDGRVTNKHVMGEKFLNVTDKRAGF